MDLYNLTKENNDLKTENKTLQKHVGKLSKKLRHQEPTQKEDKMEQ